MLRAIRAGWKARIEEELYKIAETNGKVSLPELIVQTPPKVELGDIAFPLFAQAKVLGMSPPALANELKNRLDAQELLVSGPYLNVRIDMNALALDLTKAIRKEGDAYGHNRTLGGKRIVVEFSCPNTNKPLHLGHLRNDSIGESISAILKANGAEVRKVNLINNRGVHICKSMLAYRKFGNGETPESTGKKGDHFVGDYYVLYNRKAEEDPSLEGQAQAMLKAWEDGDEEVVALWEKMNRWTLEGLSQSYERMRVSFDHYYYESETYRYGRDEVLKGVEQGVFYREADNSVWVDLEAIGLDKKVLLRSDGTSLYMTQDLGTAIRRYEDWSFDSMIYVVASEQQYHFKVLFHALGLLGYPWAKDLHHLSYGMVNLPDGKMKSREGKVVDGDDLVEELTLLAKEEIIAKEREELVGDLEETSLSIALGALNYYLLQVSPTKDMIFNPAESISFNGNTGPYLQYMGARISSMLAKYEQEIPASFDASVLTLEDERSLIRQLALFGEVVERAAEGYDPSQITAYLYELSRTFSRWYHDNPVLKASTPALVEARVVLASNVLQVLKNAFALVGIPFLAAM
ncbi:MAG TPA: arginine--tRNA ligase [Sphaerochaeta sp.]|nr:arginine--tRNA ligase [Sphaerochaeta sp.]HPY45934.1 arginine--tRNA ligase [Sphaerochaeta sp.]HQB06038.1 arginine--tRNA ligase [Sphaerochaeta sp.]